jgi:exopolysaccharide production protein ExoQ
MHTPPIVALLLTIGVIALLFWRDVREKPNITGALWLPTVWMLIIGSRYISEWLNIFGLNIGGISVEEGSPSDACFYFALIASGIYILNKRQVRLSEVFRNNRWLIAFLLYCFVAIFWSDFPFVSFKRWIKVLGHPIMALILLTEPDPDEALIRLMKRCAYVIVPVSILFIKYYPELGRGFDQWSGGAVNTGITTSKNALGYDCMILGFFFFWHLLRSWRSERSTVRRNELLLIIGFLIAIWWLFSMAHSSTALMSLLLGLSMITLLGLRLVNVRLIGIYIVLGLIIWIAAEWAFGIWGQLIELLGKNPTLTDRTALWGDLLKFKINPVFGAGFESFWLGDRLRALWDKYWWQPNQAHNGYLETYLNLGLVGLFMLLALIIATYRKARLELFRDFEFGRFRLGLLAAVVAYNWTEASFKALHPVWFAFYIIALDYPAMSPYSTAEDTEPEKEDEGTVVSARLLV